MKNVIIFGATGKIGIYLIDYLKNVLNENEYKLIAVGRKYTNYFEENNIEYINFDVRSKSDFSLLPMDNVYGVINLSGILPARLKEYDPYKYLDTNVYGSLNILEYARKSKADRILYAQTWSVQGGYWGESEVLSPKMPKSLIFKGDHAFYCITKSMIEDTMEFYKQEYGLKNFVFRLPNVYMYNPQTSFYLDGIEKKVAYRYMIERAVKGQDIELWGDPDAFKDILYIKDLCQLFYKALICDKDGGTYNAGTGVKTTLKQQIQGMIEIFSPDNKKSNIIYRPEKSSFISFVMDIDNAKDELGYEPQFYYKEYLKDYKVERELKRFDNMWQVN